MPKLRVHMENMLLVHAKNLRIRVQGFPSGIQPCKVQFVGPHLFYVGLYLFFLFPGNIGVIDILDDPGVGAVANSPVCPDLTGPCLKNTHVRNDAEPCVPLAIQQVLVRIEPGSLATNSMMIRYRILYG